MKTQKYLIILFANVLFLFHQQKGYSQLEASSAAIPPFDPVGLIENEFLGEGIEVLNISFEGANESVGYFTNGTASIGIESGILLTTGVVESFGADIGINEPGSIQANADNGSNATDVDLDNLSPVSLFNMAKYTIEFIPSSDTLSFKYVFASEEYPEFVCSDYNDIFGFFISGPGISGPFQHGAINMALIPGTSSPVTINNVNGGSVGTHGVISNCTAPNGSLNYSQYYVDNDGTATQPVFDGWLTPFEAKIAVTPCEVYTIKIAIADQADPQRDSGVFLEAKSFGSENISVNLVTESIDGTVLEGCTNAALVLNLGTPRTVDTDIDLTFLGQAINGVDYQLINSTVTIPAGQNSDTIFINALEDGIAEGIEELKIAVQINTCRTDTFSLYLNDFDLPAPNLDDFSICHGIAVNLDGSTNVNIPNPVTIGSADNNLVISSPLPGQTPSAVISTLPVVGVQPLQLGPDIIQSVCINIEHNRLEDLNIYLKAPGGQLIPLSTDNGAMGDHYSNTCFRSNAVDNITTGTAPFTGNYQPEGNWADLWFGDSPINGTWELQVIDDATGFSGVLLDWEITFNPVFSLTYEWSPTSNLSCTDCPNPTATPDQTTTYTVVATDAFGCTVSDQATITVASLDFADAGSDQNICPGGSAILTGTGGINYEWSTSATTASINVMPASTTTYTVTVTDASGCTSSDEVEVTMGASLGLILDKTDITCAGGNDGTITANPIGGQSPFTYTWSNNNNINTSTVSGLSAQTYSVTVQDANGCSAMASIAILDQLPFIISMDSMSTCQGISNGEAVVNIISGGVMPYQYMWNAAANNQTTAIANNLEGGIYTVTVTDNNYCTATGSTIVESNDTIITPTPSCGTITNNSITFIWTDDPNATSFEVNIDNGGWMTPTSNFAHTVNGLALGQTVQFKVRANGNCNNPVGEVICTTFNCTPINLMVQSQGDISCFMANDGATTLSAIGSNPPFTYSLKLDGSPNTNSNTDGIFDNLEAGNYSATVEDALGCIETSTVIISSPDELFIQGQVINQPSCTTSGSVTVTVLGGTYPYTFAWDTASTDSILTNLSGGTYTVTVTDQNGCSEIVPVDLDTYTPMTATLDIDQIDCSGNDIGAIEVITQGGTPPFSYLWNDPQNQTTAIASDLAAGTYIVTITDAIGCVDSIDAVLQSVEQPNFGVAVDQSECEGESGNILITPISGQAPYLVSLGGNTFTDLFEWNNLSPGNYTIKITDTNGCSKDTTNIMIETATPVQVDLESLLEVVVGDSLQLTPQINNGTDPFLYQWSSNDSIYFSCNACPNPYVIPNTSSTVNLTVTDQNGCVGEAITRILVDPNRKVYIPNAFSPNGDGMNDTFTIYTKAGAQIEELQIFNRWGEKVFQRNDFAPNQNELGWNGVFKGKRLRPDVFVYWVRVSFPHGPDQFYRGDITLMK